MEPKICTYALGHLNHQIIDDRVSACYRCNAALGNHRTQLMSEITNGEPAREHRKKLMSGEWPDGCVSCRDFEENGGYSTRMFSLQDKALVDEILSGYDHATGSIDRLDSIELRFGNQCNLACRHCSAQHSSRWESLIRNNPGMLERLHRDVEERASDASDAYISDILENVVPGLREIYFSGGEVLFQKKHYEFLDSIKPEHAANIRLRYVTNGTIRTIGSWDLMSMWRRFAKVTVVVSTDGVGDRFDYFRHGANWLEVEENIRYWSGNGLDVCCEITCSVYQLFYLIETIGYLHDNGIGRYISSSIVQYPPVINPRIIPRKHKIRIRDEWEQCLRGISDPGKLWVFKHAGQRIIDFMMGDNLVTYDPTKPIPTWDDFRSVATAKDELFGTSLEKVFPRIYQAFDD
jgi:MoaA/NifB/PqqE/SkfB family radical SAM enzyme